MLIQHLVKREHGLKMCTVKILYYTRNGSPNIQKHGFVNITSFIFTLKCSNDVITTQLKENHLISLDSYYIFMKQMLNI